MIQEKKWNDGTPVTKLPEYVRAMVDMTECIRGESRIIFKGEIMIVKGFGKLISLCGSLRWQRHPYRNFMPATKGEFISQKFNL